MKHRYSDNFLKLYDKVYTPVGSVLRAELTMQTSETILGVPVLC